MWHETTHKQNERTIFDVIGNGEVFHNKIPTAHTHTHINSDAYWRCLHLNKVYDMNVKQCSQAGTMCTQFQCTVDIGKKVRCSNKKIVYKKNMKQENNGFMNRSEQNPQGIVSARFFMMGTINGERTLRILHENKTFFLLRFCVPHLCIIPMVQQQNRTVTHTDKVIHRSDCWMHTKWKQKKNKKELIG